MAEQNDWPPRPSSLHSKFDKIDFNFYEFTYFHHTSTRYPDKYKEGNAGFLMINVPGGGHDFCVIVGSTVFSRLWDDPHFVEQIKQKFYVEIMNILLEYDTNMGRQDRFIDIDRSWFC